MHSSMSQPKAKFESGVDSYLESWRLSWQVVRRNWWVYRKDLIANISPSIADPLFLILSLGLGLGSFVTGGIAGRTYLQYLAPGMAVTTAMFTAFFETSYGFYVRMTFENIFKAMLTTPIGVREVVWGEFLWVALKGALMLSLVSLFLALFGLFRSPIWILMCPLVGILVALPLGAMGLLASCYVRNINQFQSVYSFIIAPIYFFSGIFFPVDRMPAPAQWMAECLPLYHGVRLSQSLFWNEDIAAVWSVHGLILVAYSGVLMVFASYKLNSKLQN